MPSKLKYLLSLVMLLASIWLLWFLPREDPYYATAPSAELSPYEAVKNQLEALRHNDYPQPDYGIEVLYNFMDTEHVLRAEVLDDFITLWHNPVYSDMLNMATYRIEEHFVEKDEAVFFVFLESQDAEKYMYIFELVKRKTSEHDSIWLNQDVRLYDKVAKPVDVEITI